MANKILVVLEQRNGELKRASFEVLRAASNMAKKLGAEIESIAIGNEINDLEKVGGYGVGKVNQVKAAELELYSSSAYSKLISDFAKNNGFNYVFLANTAFGKDLAPRIAVKLEAGILMDCVNLVNEGGELVGTRPVYAGKALIDSKISSENKVFTLRPNVFNMGESDGNSAQVDLVSAADLDLSTKVVEVKKSAGKLDVAEAEIIVSGGRGLKAAENFNLVEQLADVLGAAVGASRAVVDAGWRPHAEQVGQTGKTVSPTLYVAVGISGAIQHLAGMRSSKYIVAINKDKDAPIFGVADYGIAGDAFEVVPALIEEIKKIKS